MPAPARSWPSWSSTRALAAASNRPETNAVQHFPAPAPRPLGAGAGSFGAAETQHGPLSGHVSSLNRVGLQPEWPWGQNEIGVMVPEISRWRAMRRQAVD